MKTNNPKDSKEEIYVLECKSKIDDSLFLVGHFHSKIEAVAAMLDQPKEEFVRILKFKENVEEKHFPGCHKVHIECANKKIEEAKNIMEDICNDENCHCESVKWLKNLGEK